MDFFYLTTLKFWGDFGDVLLNGLSAHLPRSNGKIQLERTGPFVPPISLPGVNDFVVTNKAKESLEAGFDGLQFLPVRKKHIVESDWNSYDLQESCPRHLRGTSPGKLIWSRPHSRTTSKSLGELWEVLLPSTQVVVDSDGEPWSLDQQYTVHLDSWSEYHLFRASNRGGVFVTQEGKSLLSAIDPKWLKFEACSTC